MGNSKLKITIFDGSFNTTPFIQRLVKGLVSHGHNVSIIGFNEHNPNPISKVTYQSLGSNRSKFKLIWTSLQLALDTKKKGTIAATIKLIGKGNRKKLQEQNLSFFLKNLNPDVVHLQWPSLVPWMEPYMPNKNFKVVLSQRGYHTNVRPFIDADNGNYLQKWYPKLDGLHSVSKAISKMGKKIGQPHTQIDQVVYTGLALDEFDYKPITQKWKQPLHLLSVGRPHWKKDYPTALKACALLKKRGVAFHYTIIGAAGDEEVLFLINEFSLQDNIILTDKISQKKVYKEMRKADVLLLPSVEEGIANVAVEAMALGLPVISTDCGGINELIASEEEGWVVPNKNPKTLVAAIKKFKSLSLEDINIITIAARKKVEQQHTEKKMILDMETLYYKMMHS